MSNHHQNAKYFGSMKPFSEGEPESLGGNLKQKTSWPLNQPISTHLKNISERGNFPQTGVKKMKTV